MTDKSLAIDAWESLFRAQVSVLRQLTAEFPTSGGTRFTVTLPV